MGNLILFGAGASFGSDDDGDTPPLGESLFDALCTFNSEGWGAVPQQFADLFRADFEQGMHEFTKAHGGQDVDILQRAMAGYFFQFRPRPQSLYRRLARCAEQTGWDGAFATLNYERLLELAFQEAGLELHAHGISEANDGMEICLPHGCCHLFGPIRAQGNISFASNIRFDGPEGGIHAIHDPSEFHRRLREDAIPPVMSYFEPQKTTRSGVSFIESQRNRYAELVAGAEAVGVVGVRVRPHDAHIWEVLRETKARIIYCAGESGGEEFQTWAADSDRPDDQVLPSSWTEGFDDVCSAAGIEPCE